jgi:general secretion pathway protein D
MRLQSRSFLAILVVACMLALPLSAFAKKGKDHYDRGMTYEHNQQWEQAAHEFTLALAADPSNVDYRLHYQRSMFNASQMFMQRGRSLAEQSDFVGAYNAFRQSFGYDPVNQLAVSEMERMLRLQDVKEGKKPGVTGGGDASKPDSGDSTTQTEASANPKATQAGQQGLTRPEITRSINFNGPLQTYIRTLTQELGLNVIFDKQSFATPRNIEINLAQPTTTAKALDFVFLQEGLFFQKLDRNTILVADQARRPQYQQLVVRTFYLSNAKPQKVKEIISQALPASVGRPSSITVIDEDTNSLTVRDTAENVQLIGELIKGIDKDRAEVVMDVNIYEVNRSDLLQMGNQMGAGTFNLGGSPGLSVLTSNAATTARDVGVNVASILGGVPTAAAAALVIPPSVLTMFQSKNNLRLLAATQVHAFNNEESTARIGQRVPVQTAQAYPFGIQTGQPNASTGNAFPTGGFPVINYEPTGLTLNFTPIVFPNLDVQVKMKINSKDVSGASSLTPTFIEREITGTARVQNNRTMLLASVSTNVESNGRAGLPVLSGLPVLGRFFTSPTKDNRQVDIVISVTPRVLRAPALTPRDEEMRPSGTLQAPTTGSIAQMLAENAREDQIASARRIPREVNLQLPDMPNTYEPATNAAAANPSNANTQVATATAPRITQVSDTKPVPEAAKATEKPNREVASVTTEAAPPPKTAAATAQTETSAPPPTLDVAAAVKSVVSQTTSVSGTAANAKTDVALTPVVETLAPKKESADASKSKEPTASVIQLSIAPDKNELQIGEKRQLSVQVSTDTSLRLALIALHFDPRVVKINSVSPGSLFDNARTAPVLTQSIDEQGTLLVSLTPAPGSSVSGEGSLIKLDVEAAGIGDGTLIFDPANVNLIANDGRTMIMQVEPGHVTVKSAEAPAPKPIPQQTSTVAPAKEQSGNVVAAPGETTASGKLGAASAQLARVLNDPTPLAADKPKTYVIQKHDNLWKIATDNGTTVEALRQANPRLRNPILTVGTELVIP